MNFAVAQGAGGFLVLFGLAAGLLGPGMGAMATVLLLVGTCLAVTPLLAADARRPVPVPVRARRGSGRR